MTGSKTSLGIDISESRICFVLLGQSLGKIRMIKSGVIATPDGAMRDGNVADPVLLAKGIKELLGKNGIRKPSAMLSLAVKPSLVRLIELGDEIPDNVDQFVQSEIKHNAAFAGKDTIHDFCGVSSVAGSADRIFVSAADKEGILALLKATQLVGVDVIGIEPVIVAYLRAIYNKRIRKKYNSNVLITLVEKSTVTVCVFRKESLDFIRSIEIGNEVKEAGDYIERCKTEIDAVVQFYDIEVEGAEDKWELSVMFRDMDVDSEVVEKELQAKFGNNISVRSDSTVYADTIVEANEDISSAPLTAVGLAMNPLKTAGPNIAIDLVPRETRNTKAVKKLLLLTANVAAVTLLLIFLISGVVARKFCNIQEAVEKTNNADMVVSIRRMLGKEKLIESQITRLDREKTVIDSISEEDPGIDFWPGILGDIGKSIPEKMYIIGIFSAGDHEITIEGKTLSGKAVYRFAAGLTESQFLESANVEKVNDNAQHKGVVDYIIRCRVVDNRRLQANAK